MANVSATPERPRVIIMVMYGIDKDLIQHRSVRTTDYLFRAPASAMALPLVLGFIPVLYMALAILWQTIYGMIIFLAHALIIGISPFILHYGLRRYNRITYLRRWTLLMLINIMVFTFAIILLYPLKTIFRINLYTAICFSMALMIFYNAIIFRATTAKSNTGAIVLAEVFSSSIAVPLMVKFVTNNDLYIPLIKFMVVITLPAITSYAFFHIISRPFRATFNRSPLDLLQSSLEQFTTQGKGGIKDLEDFFESIATEWEAKAKVIVFNCNSNKMCSIIVPNVHPGPYGKLGGSELVDVIHAVFNKSFGKDHKCVVMHGASSHDLDPVKHEYSYKIAREIVKAIANNHSSLRKEGTNTLSMPIRVRYTNFSLVFQQIGQTLLVMYTSAPEPTDDIEYDVGQAIEKTLKDRYGYKDIIFVDCHNSLKEGAGSIYAGSERAKSIIECLKSELTARAIKDLYTQKHNVKFACIQTSIPNAKGDIGHSIPLTVLVFKSGNKNFAYIVINGNNMVPGLKEKIQSAARKYVGDCEVLTTDTHSVNLKIGGYRPVGSETSHRDIINGVLTALSRAIKTLKRQKETRVTVLNIDCGRIKVLGKNRATEITAIINRTVALLLPSYVILNIGLTIIFGIVNIIVG